jgi:thioredoxin reductase (NADPH)
MPLPSHSPALIVGAGPIGLACAISARRRGIEATVIDTGAIAESIVRYPIGMRFFTTAERLEIGGHPFACVDTKPTREEALAYYRRVAQAEQLAVHPRVRLLSAHRESDGTIRCTLRTPRRTQEHRTDRLVIATGYFEHPNLLGVPGEALPHVSHWFDEPHRNAGLDVVIIGGKNSAIETALQCWRAGARVTLLHRGEALKPSVKYWLRPDFENRVAAGEIRAHFGTVVEAITAEGVHVRHADGRTVELAADRVFALTGYHPDFEMMDQIGISLDPVSGRPALDPATMETNVAGVYLAGSAAAGRHTGEVFIENGRFDGEKIFGDAIARAAASARYAASPRPVGE